MVKEHNLQDQVAFCIRNPHTKKELDPNIHILDYIDNMERKSMLYVMVANYTNKHIIFNRGQCIRHMEPPIDWISQTPFNSITTQKMMDDQVHPENLQKMKQALS